MDLILKSISRQMRQVLQTAANAAVTKATILIQGESGTGKELLARQIHAWSPRKAKKFFAVNCAAIPEGLLEAELFGYERGAFTGASKTKPGRIEAANGSTFLLDEIGDMPLALQVKLLRVLQENELERLGGSAPRSIDVRFIATTHQPLKALVSNGKFREDLYYRLNVVNLELPPLRARREDIDDLVCHFLRETSERNGLPHLEVTPSAMTMLKNYAWPGNIRELQNSVERLILAGKGQGVIDERCLREGLGFADDCAPSSEENRSTLNIEIPARLADVERQIVEATLRWCEGSRARAAEALGINVRTLRMKLETWRMDQANEVERDGVSI